VDVWYVGRFTCNKLRERLETDDIITEVKQNRITWYGYVSRKDENDWVNKIHGL